MTDKTVLKAAAEACGPLPWRVIEMGVTRLGVRDDNAFIAIMDIGHPAKYGACPEREAKARFIGHATPAAVLALIAESDRLVAQLCVCPSCHGQGEVYSGHNTWEGHFQPPEPIMEKCGECDGDGVIGDADDLKSLLAERDQLKADNERLGRNRDMWKGQVERQAEELTRLRKALTECADSLHAEMLQKFGGQLPDDMHPVTRREYDRDMVEVAGYRVATAKADEDIPDFTPGNGNTARRRAEALGLDYDAALGMGERP